MNYRLVLPAQILPLTCENVRVEHVGAARDRGSNGPLKVMPTHRPGAPAVRTDGEPPDGLRGLACRPPHEPQLRSAEVSGPSEPRREHRPAGPSPQREPQDQRRPPYANVNHLVQSSFAPLAECV
jgi:hypothetical protein